MTTLISFLGKTPTNAGGSYRTTKYRFSDDFVRTLAFFGLGLKEYLNPARLILAGTSGSMWDVFFENEIQGDNELEQLMEAVEHDRVTASQLQSYEQRLTQRLGIPVQCLLIPYGRNSEEQIRILHDLAALVEAGERVTLDVTHSFRHLPMLMMVAARYLTHVRRVTVKNIFYGAYEMRDKGSDEAPALQLGSLLRMLDWTDALAIYNKNGDYSVFQPLLQEDGMAEDKAAQLAKGAFAERTSNPVHARQALHTAKTHLEQHNGPLGHLFRDTLIENINWIGQGSRHDWERALADRYLEREDYLRATTFMYESRVSWAVYQEKGNSNNYEERKNAYESLRMKSADARTLENLRNSLVHGVRAETESIQRLLENKALLHKELRRIQKSLFKN